jgi:IS30 family transposase
MTYTHLSQEERCQIYTLRRQDISLARIAAELQRNSATISNELKCNTGPNGQKPAGAHKQTRTRQCQQRKARHFSVPQWSYVKARLRCTFNPGSALELKTTRLI